jgi:hypothetical protein
VIEGWSNQRDTLVYPSIEIDAPVAGDRTGRTATVIREQNFFGDFTGYLVHMGSIEIPIQLRVTADSKLQRAALDHSIDVILAGDFHDEGAALAVSDPVSDYYEQVFQFRQTGGTRYFDSATTAGRDEFTSLREVEADGNVLIEYVAKGLVELSVSMKVTEAGRDFDLVVAENVVIFDTNTP